MSDVRLEVTDTLGRRVVPVEKALFTIGRRTESDLRVVSSDVSRDHAEIALSGDGYLVRDRSSRYGTYVNGDGVTDRASAAAAGRAARRSTRCGRWRRCSKAFARSGRGTSSTKCSRSCWTRQS